MLENNLPDGGTKQNLQIYRVSPSCCLQYICGIFFLDTIFQCQQFVLKYAATYSQTIFLVDPCKDNVWYTLTFQFVQFQLHLLLLFHNHYLPNFSSIEVKKLYILVLTEKNTIDCPKCHFLWPLDCFTRYWIVKQILICSMHSLQESIIFT